MRGQPQREVSAPSPASCKHVSYWTQLGALVGFFHPFTFQTQSLYLSAEDFGLFWIYLPT